ncbi:MAG TPA: sigma factor-like helix-turn-helix DNA-binding protein [Kofleriaceae bacterium]|nr:sigma factor-like helix-turn-helix DNA-binding protein [Kofleriaceae bacterium]
MSESAVLERARAVYPAAWLTDAEFLAHVRAVRATEEDLAALHAADLYLACACARGCPEALVTLEREHLTRIREYAAGVAHNAEEVSEVAQRVRARLLVAEPGRSPRIATYSGRGSLGGWIRVTAVRVARDLWRGARQHEPVREELEPGVVSPELGYWKRAYGEVVSRAVQDALESLDGEPRALLKMHYVDGLSIDQVGLAVGKSRATGARMLAAARQRLLAGIRERLVGALGVRQDEGDSLLAFVRSRLDVSLGRAFRR